MRARSPWILFALVTLAAPACKDQPSRPEADAARAAAQAPVATSEAPPEIAEQELIPGTPVTLVAGDDDIHGLSVQGSEVQYVRSSNDGFDLMKIEAAGGRSAVIARGVSVNARADANNVYWLKASGGGESAVMARPRGGGPGAILSKERGALRELTIDETRVYWIADGIGDAKSSLIRRVSKSSGVAATVASAQEPVTFAVDDTYLYWVQIDGAVMKASKRTDQEARNLGKIPTDGIGRSWWPSIAVGIAAVYVTGQKSIFEITKDGRSTTLAMVDVPGFASHGVGLQSTTIYWAIGDRILRVPAAGGHVAAAAHGGIMPTLLAAGDAGVFWVADRSIKKLGPPRGAPPPALTLTEQAAAERLVRQSGPASVGVPGGTLANVTMTLPLMFMLELEDKQQFDVMVLGGRVIPVRGASAADQASYLRAIHFLERREVSAQTLLGLTMPSDGPCSSATLRHDPKKGGLAYDADHATLTAFAAAPRTPGAPAVVHRCTLRIDATYAIQWQAE